MTKDPSAFRPSDDELKEALQAAVRKPFDEVDWDRLREGIMADAETHFHSATGRPYDWVTAWSSRGIPVAASALAAAAAVALLWIVPIMRPGGEAPPGFWPVAEELVLSLPESTRLLLSAGSDGDSMLTALMVYGGEER